MEIPEGSEIYSNCSFQGEYLNEDLIMIGKPLPFGVNTFLPMFNGLYLRGTERMLEPLRLEKFIVVYLVDLHSMNAEIRLVIRHFLEAPTFEDWQKLANFEVVRNRNLLKPMMKDQISMNLYEPYREPNRTIVGKDSQKKGMADPEIQHDRERLSGSDTT